MADIAALEQAWQHDIDGCRQMFASIGEHFAGASQANPVDYSIWLEVPDPNSSWGQLGLALKRVLEGNGIRTITRNDVAKETIDAHQRNVDSVVVVALTEDVELECLAAVASDIRSRILIFYRNDRVAHKSHEILLRFGVSIELFDFNGLQAGQATKLGLKIFHALANRFLKKSADRAKKIRLSETVVVTIPGIRDHALWQDIIKRELSRNGLVVEPTNYGRFPLLKFLIPFPRIFRESAIKQVARDLALIQNNYRDCTISILAHSFGTFIAGTLLVRNGELKIGRLALCGSVLRYDFPFQNLEGRHSGIVNDIGCKDPWPVVVEGITFGYGSTGTYGFKRHPVADRWHKDLGHGHFLTADFCSRYWTPFFEDGEIVPSGATGEIPPIWARIAGWNGNKYFLWVLLPVLAIFRGIQLL